MNIKSDVKGPVKHLTSKPRVFGLGTQVLGLGLGFRTQVLGLGIQVLGLEPQVLVNINAFNYCFSLQQVIVITNH